MPEQSQYYVQTFEVRDGRPVPEFRLSADDAAGCIEKAQDLSASFIGTTALCLTRDEDRHISGTKVLATFGTVADEWLDGSPG